MSRSRRKSPIRGITTSDTEKRDKRIANRRLRRAVRVRLSADPDDVLPSLREVSSVWSFNKDGKTRFDQDARPAWMRK